MVFAFNIDLLDRNWREGKTGCVFAETIEITPTGARRMHTFPTEFQRVPTAPSSLAAMTSAAP